MTVTILNYQFPLGKYYLLMMLVIKLLVCHGQKEAFIENVFKKEFSELHKEHTDFKKEIPCTLQENIAIPLYTSPAVLPHWFINPPLVEKNVCYAIGISDPWMEDQIARKQAFGRARGIASMMYRLNTKGVQETFDNDGNNKFQQISQFNAFPKEIVNWEPIDSITTKYREMIILCKFTFGDEKEDSHTAIEYFISSDNQKERFNQFEKLRLNTIVENRTSAYESMEINRNQLIKSILNGDTIQIIPATYRYSTNDNSGNDTEVCLLVSGLWQGYLKALVQQLDISAADLSSKMKSLSDSKETESSASSLKHLIRTIYDLSFSFSIVTSGISHNSLELDLKLVKD